MVSDGDNRSHGVEEVGEHEGEDDQKGPQKHSDVEVTVNQEAAEQVDVTQQAQIGQAEVLHPGQPWDVEGPAGGILLALRSQVSDGLNDDSEQGGTNDRDEHGSLDVTLVQHDEKEESEQAQEDRPAFQAAADTQGDGGAGAATDDARVHETNEGDEQANSDADRRA